MARPSLGPKLQLLWVCLVLLQPRLHLVVVLYLSCRQDPVCAVSGPQSCLQCPEYLTAEEQTTFQSESLEFCGISRTDLCCLTLRMTGNNYKENNKELPQSGTIYISQLGEPGNRSTCTLAWTFYRIFYLEKFGHGLITVQK